MLNKAEFDRMKTRLATVVAKREALVAAEERARKTVLDLQERSVIADYALAVSRGVYDSRIGKFVQELQDIVSAGLSKVFGKKYEFRVDYRVSGVVFEIASDDTAGEFVDILDSHGGGVVQVTAFLLHVYALSYSGADKVVMLDEHFNNVSKEFKPALAKLIVELGEQMGFQFILVSHDAELIEYLAAAPKSIAYTVSLKNGQTTAERW